MTPEQQSIAASEILGITQCNPAKVGTQDLFHEKGKGFLLREDLPAFHLDANTTLLLVEWAKQTLGLWFECDEYDDGWTATFSNKDALFDYKAHTFQLAILGAFLRANGKDISC